MSFLKEELIAFFHKYQNGENKILVGLSGGTDSLALYHLLLELRKKFQFSLGIAHINHNWRKESVWELSRLRELAVVHGVPFHSLSIDPSKLTGNLEDACRNIRLEFFRKTCQKYGYQAVVLGHHADDLAETVLKRLFEGASANHLACMRPTNAFNGLSIWRPLLKVKKNELAKFLEAKKITPFEDSTNLDSRFLRGRMRTSLIPELSRTFGKDIRSSLCRLSEESDQMESFLQAHLQSYLDTVQEGPFGRLLDLSEKMPGTEWELAKLVQMFVKRSESGLSYEQFRQVIRKIVQGEADGHFFFGDKELIVDRKKLFIVKAGLKFEDFSLKKVEDGFWQNWQISLIEGPEEEKETIQNWKNCWTGSFEVLLPKGNYKVGLADQSIVYVKNKSLKDWWTANKVPSFLKNIVPVIWFKKEIVHEFLTGRRLHWEKKQVGQKIVFKYIMK